MNERIRMLVYSSLLYVSTLAVGLATAWRHVINPSLGSVAPVDMTIGNGITFLAVFGVFTFIMARFSRAARISLPVMLVIILLLGGNFTFAGWLAWPYSLAAMAVLAALAFVLPIVITHDIAIIAGIAGISAMLGLSLTPLVASVALALLSLYDIISVYRTRHMVALAGNMLSSGAVFGFLVPSRLGDFLSSRKTALDSRRVMLLGSGDIGLPLVLASSVVSQSVGAAIIVAGFSLAGLLLMHWLFSSQERREPMAALPPIAMSAIVGYVLAIVLGF